MQMDTLRDLLVHDLKDLLSAERQITKALPKMIKGATSPELQDALSEHLAVTQKQVERLKQAFDRLGLAARADKKCKGMEGLLEEGAEMLEEDSDCDVLDAGLITAAQKVEHYEIAGYGSAIAYARLLGETRIARLLEETLEEEKVADQKLTAIAESAVNVEAAA